MIKTNWIRIAEINIKPFMKLPKIKSPIKATNDIANVASSNGPNVLSLRIFLNLLIILFFSNFTSIF